MRWFHAYHKNLLFEYTLYLNGDEQVKLDIVSMIHATRNDYTKEITVNGMTMYLKENKRVITFNRKSRLFYPELNDYLIKVYQKKMSLQKFEELIASLDFDSKVANWYRRIEFKKALS